jgi:hypothetical protein
MYFWITIITGIAGLGALIIGIISDQHIKSKKQKQILHQTLRDSETRKKEERKADVKHKNALIHFGVHALDGHIDQDDFHKFLVEVSELGKSYGWVMGGGGRFEIDKAFEIKTDETVKDDESTTTL